MTVKIINNDAAKSLLSEVGMTVGKWERIEYISCKESHHAINYQAPNDVRRLYCFSLRVATWLPASSWKLLRLDTSTVLAWDEELLLGRILLGEFDSPDFTKNRSFLFDFGDKQDINRKTELIIADLIYFLLMFECHGYIVSSASKEGEILAIQDGFVGFISRGRDISGAQSILSEYENNPMKLPEWMHQFDIISGKPVT